MTGLCSRRTLLTIAGAAAVSSITAAHAADGKTSKPAKRTWPDSADGLQCRTLLC